MLLSDLVRQGPRRLQPMQPLPYGDPRQMNNGTFLGALASGLTRGLQAYQEQKDAEADKKAKGKLSEAIMGATKGWRSPDDITGPDGEIVSKAGQIAPGTQGLPNLVQRLEMAMGQNPEMADRLAPYAIQASMDSLGQAQEQAAREEERAWRQQIREEDRQWQMDDRQAQQAFQMQMLRAQQAAAAANRAPPAAIQQYEYAVQQGFKGTFPEYIAMTRATIERAPSGYQQAPDGSLMPIPGGPADPSTKPMTEGQSNAATYADRMTQANQVIGNLEEAAMDKGDRLAAGLDMFGGVGEMLGNSLMSPEYQQVQQAQRDFINSILRRESGAVISDAEFANAQRQYFPQPGDSPQVLEQKRRNRETAISGIVRAAGPSYQPPDLPAGVPAEAPTQIEIRPRQSGQASPAAPPPTPPADAFTSSKAADEYLDDLTDEQIALLPAATRKRLREVLADGK